MANQQATASRAAPSARVSIGLPVYNGENYLRDAVDSILTQTFHDLELVISDNGSTDGTERICREYAERDPRVRYQRSETNQGATWNYNRVVQLARGEYFRWAAHDDRIAPECIERSVAVLDENPDVVLCHTQVEVIDQEGKSHGIYQDAPLAHVATRPHSRFRDMIRGHRCFEIFGLIRTSALRAVGPLGAYGHADGILLSRLSLLGSFYEIPEPLFAARMHAEQSMNVYGSHTGKTAEADGPPDYHAYTAWYDPKKAGKLVFPYWRMLGEHVHSVLAARRLALGQRVFCGVHVLGWVRRHRYWLGQDLKIAGQRLRSR